MDHPERRDANGARILEFRKQVKVAKDKFFDPMYGDRQLNLMILATHPSYRRLGAARMMMDWGIEKARKERLSITLLSSPMGLFVYEKLGFKSMGQIHVQVEGEEEFLELPVMSWTSPEGKSSEL